jgi:N-methylhydantoinase A/oxoprolinase/acetone carboxylase beta subunit
MRERVRAPEPGAGDGADGERARAYSFTEGGLLEFSLLDRGTLPVGTTVAGPALIAEETAMTYLDSGFGATVDPTGSLLIEPDGGEGGG